MRPGIGSAEMLERFRLERDVLARLTHPAIVPLLDGGITSDGRPYLALQYVEGLPITEHCERAEMSRPDRLRLFVDLCRAVQYAHTNLIVHRDLKPSNVLVTAEGEIRLLDFGVAKLLGVSGPGREITGSARAPMTQRRAAPEQHTGADATTATDVWSLGVLLHELLTGRIPLAGTGDESRTDRSGMATGLPRDLTSIIGMALAPEPAKRYPSAGHLADDVERSLANLPVEARPDSWLYRAGRYVRRHPTLTALGAATALFLVILSTVSSLQTIRITHQRNRAEAEEQRANAVVDLLVELFGATDPLQGAEMDMILVADLMDRGEAHANRMEDQPDIQARLRAVLGKILLERGDQQRGRALLESALESQIRFAGLDDPRSVEITLDYVRALHLDGELDAARTLVRETVERLEIQDDPDPRQLARALQILGSLLPTEEGEQLIERAISIRRGLPSIDPVQQGSRARRARHPSPDPRRARRGPGPVSGSRRSAPAGSRRRPSPGPRHPQQSRVLPSGSLRPGPRAPGDPPPALRPARSGPPPRRQQLDRTRRGAGGGRAERRCRGGISRGLGESGSRPLRPPPRRSARLGG